MRLEMIFPRLANAAVDAIRRDHAIIIAGERCEIIDFFIKDKLDAEACCALLQQA